MQRMFDENRTRLGTERKGTSIALTLTLWNTSPIPVPLKALKRCIQLVEYSVCFSPDGEGIKHRF